LTVLSQLGIAAVVVELDGTISHWNPYAEALYGRSEQEMLGASIDSIRLAGHWAERRWALKRVLERGRWRGMVEVLDASGARVQLDAHATRLDDAEGRPVAVLGAFRELDGMPVPAPQPPRGTLIEADLSRTPEWGYFEWDPATATAALSDVLRMLLDPDGERELTAEDVEAAFSPEDLAEVARVNARLRDGEADTASYTYRIRRPDGRESWVESHSEAIRSDDGQLIRIRGTTRDITTRIQLANQMQDAAEVAQSTLDSLPAQVAILDERGCIVAVNRAWREFAAQEGDGRDFMGADYPAACDAGEDRDGRAAAQGIRRLLAGTNEGFEREYPCHSPTERRWFMLRATRCEGPGPARVVVMHEDVTAQHELRQRLAVQDGMLNRLNAAVTVTDADGALIEWNEAAEQLYGWTAAEAIGRDQIELLEPIILATGEPATLGNRTGRWDGEYRVRRRDGSSTLVYTRLHRLTDDDGERIGLASVAVDISDRKGFERELVRAHNYMRAITESVGEGLFALDSDGRVTFMNEAAQEMLGWSIEQLEGRIMHAIIHTRHADGSDFAIEDCPITRARRDGVRVRINDDIFIRADGSELPVAYTAAPFVDGNEIDGCVVVFADISQRKAEERESRRDQEKRSWVERVQRALAEDGFELYAQPIFDLQTDELVQRELLLRMKPEDGSQKMIGPGSFLPAAEESGLIAEVDRWVIDRAAEIAADGQPVELNVSAASISDPSLVDYIRRTIGRTGADPAALVFEITETTLISDEAAARAFVEGLHRLGCKIALDDFGTGYGGFTYLQQLPIDYLKIDIEFVRDLKYDPASQKVVEAVVNLARGFGLTTVGEGVEDEETLELLRGLGVDRAQGFHIGRPAPLDPVQSPTSSEESGER
jgi:PAS domain S-box-containing protein